MKVPLWGGFSGNGKFCFKLWTETAKLNKEIWADHVSKTLKPAIEDVWVDEQHQRVTPQVWHDNEGFLKQPDIYKACGLRMVAFPPNSGDLNPIENAWAELRKELAKREMADMDAGKYLTVAQYRARASQILHSFSVPTPGGRNSYLQRLVRGMPKRLARCKSNKFGKCGK